MININIYCSNCQQQYQFIKDEESASSIKCEKCGNTLVDISPIKGYLYILSNPSMPDLLKIGFTTRSVDERIAELNSSTGVPENFVLEAYFGSNTPENDERLLHRRLNNYRTNKSREFFQIPILDAIKEVANILGRPPGLLNKNRQKELELIQKKNEEDDELELIQKQYEEEFELRKKKKEEELRKKKKKAEQLELAMIIKKREDERLELIKKKKEEEKFELMEKKIKAEQARTVKGRPFNEEEIQILSDFRKELQERGLFRYASDKTKVRLLCNKCRKRFYSTNPVNWDTMCPYCFSRDFEF